MSKTVLITGAGIGIGRATAKAFAKAGYTVVATDVLEKEGAAVADEIVRGGGKAEFHKLDVRSTEAADAVVAAAEKKYGGIDAIIANAGIAHRVPLARLDDEKWDHTFEIDLKGILPRCPPRRRGHACAQGGRDRVPLLHHGRRLWMGRACPLFLGEGRRRRPRARARGRAREGRRPGERRRSRLHPHRATPQRRALARTSRAPKRRALSFPWAELANPKRSRTSLCFWRRTAPAT